MSPGVRWGPFEVTEIEYAGALPHILNPKLNNADDEAYMRRHVDPELEHFTEYSEWAEAAADKHGAAYVMRMDALQLEMVRCTNKK